MTPPAKPEFETLVDALRGNAVEAPPHRAAAAPDALDGIARLWSEAGYAAPGAMRSAYGEAAPTEAVGHVEVDLLALPSVALDAIEAELNLKAVSSLEELNRLRRRFAAANHPDAVPVPLRERAQRRMALANALFDGARRRLERSDRT